MRYLALLPFVAALLLSAAGTSVASAASLTNGLRGALLADDEAFAGGAFVQISANGMTNQGSKDPCGSGPPCEKGFICEAGVCQAEPVRPAEVASEDRVAEEGTVSDLPPPSKDVATQTDGSQSYKEFMDTVTSLGSHIKKRLDKVANKKAAEAERKSVKKYVETLKGKLADPDFLKLDLKVSTHINEAKRVTEQAAQTIKDSSTNHERDFNLKLQEILEAAKQHEMTVVTKVLDQFQECEDTIQSERVLHKYQMSEALTGLKNQILGVAGFSDELSAEQKLKVEAVKVELDPLLSETLKVDAADGVIQIKNQDAVYNAARLAKDKVPDLLVTSVADVMHTLHEKYLHELQVAKAEYNNALVALELKYKNDLEKTRKDAEEAKTAAVLEAQGVAAKQLQTTIEELNTSCDAKMEDLRTTLFAQQQTLIKEEQNTCAKKMADQKISHNQAIEALQTSIDSLRAAIENKDLGHSDAVVQLEEMSHRFEQCANDAIEVKRKLGSRKQDASNVVSKINRVVDRSTGATEKLGQAVEHAKVVLDAMEGLRIIDEQPQTGEKQEKVSDEKLFAKYDELTTAFKAEMDAKLRDVKSWAETQKNAALEDAMKVISQQVQTHTDLQMTLLSQHMRKSITDLTDMNKQCLLLADTRKSRIEESSRLLDQKLKVAKALHEHLQKIKTQHESVVEDEKLVQTGAQAVYDSITGDHKHLAETVLTKHKEHKALNTAAVTEHKEVLGKTGLVSTKTGENPCVDLFGAGRTGATAQRGLIGKIEEKCPAFHKAYSPFVLKPAGSLSDESWKGMCKQVYDRTMLPLWKDLVQNGDKACKAEYMQDAVQRQLFGLATGNYNQDFEKSKPCAVLDAMLTKVKQQCAEVNREYKLIGLTGVAKKDNAQCERAYGKMHGLYIELQKPEHASENCHTATNYLETNLGKLAGVGEDPAPCETVLRGVQFIDAISKCAAGEPSLKTSDKAVCKAVLTTVENAAAQAYTLSEAGQTAEVCGTVARQLAQLDAVISRAAVAEEVVDCNTVLMKLAPLSAACPKLDMHLKDGANDAQCKADVRKIDNAAAVTSGECDRVVPALHDTIIDAKVKEAVDPTPCSTVTNKLKALAATCPVFKDPALKGEASALTEQCREAIPTVNAIFPNGFKVRSAQCKWFESKFLSADAEAINAVVTFAGIASPCAALQSDIDVIKGQCESFAAVAVKTGVTAEACRAVLPKVGQAIWNVSGVAADREEVCGAFEKVVSSLPNVGEILSGI